MNARPFHRSRPRAAPDKIPKRRRPVFRHVLGDGTFGETLVGGQRPTR
jgi:hypothetical protein